MVETRMVPVMRRTSPLTCLLILLVCHLYCTAGWCDARVLFDFEDGTPQGWRGVGEARVWAVNGGAKETGKALKVMWVVSASGASGGAVSPAIINDGLSGYDTLVLYRKDMGNLNNYLYVYVWEDDGSKWGAAPGWAKTDWTKLLLHESEFAYIDGGSDRGGPGDHVHLNKIEKLEIGIDEDRLINPLHLTYFGVDQISLTKLEPPAQPSETPVIKIKATEIVGYAHPWLYGMQFQFPDHFQGIRAAASISRGPITSIASQSTRNRCCTPGATVTGRWYPILASRW